MSYKLDANNTCSVMPMPKSAGALLRANIECPAPMPCVVILVHGVNDNGGAYPHLDAGLCHGLNTRLGRRDSACMTYHEWDNSDGSLKKEGKSPIIPFYWGYRPVDYEAYHQDQQRYQEELKKYSTDADLPYTTYLRPDHPEQRDSTLGKRDSLSNPLNPDGIKGGGVFPCATTSIPDMYGPGSNGLMNALARGATFLAEDYATNIYNNPHRIYMVHAAQRLADLILQIRLHKAFGDDTINIIGHSQGTILTMLANFLVKKVGYRPADCVIFNNSPYGLESTAMEAGLRQKGDRRQTQRAREETLCNFTALMRDNKAKQIDLEKLSGRCIPKTTGKPLWENDPRYARDNHGAVYNYFCPYDQVVSLSNVQGIGWQGVDDKMLSRLGENFYQRVFSKDTLAGNKVEQPFPCTFPPMPEQTNCNIDNAKTPIINQSYGRRMRTINGPEVPEPFIFTLEGDIPLGAENERLYAQEYQRNTLIKELGYYDGPLGENENPAGSLSPVALQKLQQRYPQWKILDAKYKGRDGDVIIYRAPTAAEAEQTAPPISPSSQHSAIVNNEQVAEKIMAYDLAIGKANCYDNKEFWYDLLRMADWRNNRKLDGTAIDERARDYFQLGILPREIKNAMNKPNRHLPPGVVNEFEYNEYPAVGNEDPYSARVVRKVNTGLQWPMPKPDLSPAKIT